MTNREQIIAPTRECNAFFDVIAFGRNDGTLFSTNELERFYSIAFEAGAASQAMVIAAKDAEVAELVAAITRYLKENDTDGFGCSCEPDRMCGPCQTNMRQQVLRATLAKVRKP